MATTPDAKSLFTFDHSDVRFKVNYKGKTIIALVSSAAMSLASPVWKKFFFPPWKTTAAKDQATQSATTPASKKRKTAEATAKEEHDASVLPVEELDFSEDDGKALLILLRIAHLRFDENQMTLPNDIFLNLAVLCNQYLCINLVKPWLPLWLEAKEEPSLKHSRVNWLFVAWVFGREKFFKDLAIKLVYEVKKNDDRENLTGSGEQISEPMPPGIIGKCLI
jgi:hypothetical protein